MPKKEEQLETTQPESKKPELIHYAEEYRSTHEKWPYHISSGGVVYRVLQNKVYILLVKRKINRGFSYHLPKGTVMLGESLEQTAVREIAEEAGVQVELIGYLGATSTTAYKSRVQDSKTIHYYAARYVGDSPDTHDGSYDGTMWVSPKRAIFLLGKIKKKREDILVKRFMELLRTIKSAK